MILRGTFAVFVAVLAASVAFGAPSPIVPFVAPSDKPSADEVRTIVADLQAHGFDQFMVYPTTGLGYEYLGEGFFGMMDVFVEEAASRGMKLWLYDEFNWPSGTAHGRVPAENEKCLYRELVAVTNAAGEISWQTVVSRGINVDNDCLDGNNCEPEGVRRFMQLTHHAYGRRYARFMGSTIRGIFTDEPGNCSSALRLKMPEGTFLRIPSWSGMESEYAEASGGRDFRQDVETAFAKGTLATSDIFHRWVEIRSARYRKTYFDPIASWCRANGIESTGHLFQEEFADHCARINGLPLRTLKGLSKPAVDLVESFTPKAFDWMSLAFGQSAAMRSGKPGGAELMGLGPCDLTFTIMRKVYWICALHKLDTFFHATYHTRGYRFLTKDSWAMFLSPAQPWYREARLLNDAAREAASWAVKPFHCDIALVYPQRQLGSYGFVGGDFPALRDTCRELTWNGFAYDLIEEDEPTDRKIVLDWAGEALFERRTGTRFADLPSAVTWLAEKTGRTPKPGHLCRDYEDGSSVDVDLTSGQVAVLPRDAAPIQDGKTVPVAMRWQLKLDGPSKRRLWFWRSETGPKKQLPWVKDSTAAVTREVRNQEDDTCVFTVEEPLKGVRFVLRDYPAGQFKLTLDGRPLDFPVYPATSLVYSFNEICRESEPLDLVPGRHVVQLTGGHDSKMFMPVAWLVGDFAEPEEGRLTSVPKTVANGSLFAQGLGSFAGMAIYSADVAFKSGDMLRIDCGDAVARVRLGGCDLGVRGWAPYEWPIPSDLCGRKLSLEVAVMTSVRPIFGSEDSPDAKLDHVLWVRSRVANPSPIGLNACQRLMKGANQ